MIDVEQIRQCLADLNSSEAAPRLNAQVRLREEHPEMLRFLLAELDASRDEAQRAWAECRGEIAKQERKP